MSDVVRVRLSENLNFIRERIAAACKRSGRSETDVTLVAVSKYAEIEWVKELVNLGVTDLGESRPQQLANRAKMLPSHIRWHLIGHLQRNKAEDVLSVASLIHSVDSLRLFEHIANFGKAFEIPPRVLLEVNVSGETSKDGFSRDDLLTAWPRMRTCQSLEIAGLMTMAPLGNTSEVARPVFGELRNLRDQLRIESDGRWAMNDLSMGMSGDYEIGIEEGATIVRIGSRLFDGLSADHRAPENTDQSQ